MWFLLCLWSNVILSGIASAGQKKPSHMIDVTEIAKKCGPQATIKEVSVQLNSEKSTAYKYSFACGRHKPVHPSCDHPTKAPTESSAEVKASGTSSAQKAKLVRRKRKEKCYLECRSSDGTSSRTNPFAAKRKTEDTSLATDVSSGSKCTDQPKDSLSKKQAKCSEMKSAKKYRITCRKDKTPDCSWRFRCNSKDGKNPAEKANGMRLWKNAKTKRIQLYCCKMTCWHNCTSKKYFSVGGLNVKHNLSLDNVLTHVEVKKNTSKNGTIGYLVVVRHCSECQLPWPPVPVPVPVLVIGDPEPLVAHNKCSSPDDCEEGVNHCSQDNPAGGYSFCGGSYCFPACTTDDECLAPTVCRNRYCTCSALGNRCASPADCCSSNCQGGCGVSDGSCTFDIECDVAYDQNGVLSVGLPCIDGQCTS